MPSRRFVRLLILCLASLTPAAQGEELLRGTTEALRGVGAARVDGIALMSGRLLAELYAARNHRPAWSDPERVRALLEAARESRTQGLNPADFHPRTLDALQVPGALDALPRAERIAAELKLSDALLRYVLQIRFGRLDPVAVNKAWNHRPPIPAETLIESAIAVLDAPDPAARLAEIAPRPFFYEHLKRALSRYQDADRPKALPPLPQGTPLVRGARDPRVSLLRERLRLVGAAPSQDAKATGDPDTFDKGLEQAVMVFQGRAGLVADGVVGPATLRALEGSYSAEEADRIRINLERMRWFYDRLPADYVLIDVAGFLAHVVRDGQVAWTTRVVVGTPKEQTPSFRDEMEHVVFNPTWTVPPSIQKTMRGAGRFKMVDRRTGRAVRGGNASDFRRYSLIQAAGPGNALGRVKFIFPNGHAVYLHDTPSKGLFSHRARAYSHGCVRVQDPLKLAEVILESPNWDRAEIDRVVQTNRTRYVLLEEHLPVILYYLTAMAEEDGRVDFRRDIYGRDRALKQAFEGVPSEPRIAFPKPKTEPESTAPTIEASAKEPAALAPEADPKTSAPRTEPGRSLALDGAAAPPAPVFPDREASAVSKPLPAGSLDASL